MKRLLVAIIVSACALVNAQNAPSFIQGNTTGTTISSTVSFTSSVTAGDALYAAFVDGTGAGDTLTFSDTQGNSWSTVKSASLANDGDTIAIGCAIAGSSAADTVTFLINGTTAPTQTFASVYEVANGTCAPDVTPISSNTTGQTACSSGSISTATSNDLLIGLCGLSHGQTTFSAGAGWTNGLAAGWISNGSGDFASLTEMQIAGTSGTYAATSATYAISCEQASIEVAFKATTSGGGGGGAITGGGTANTIPVFTGTSTIGNSLISTTSSGNIGIGTATPGAPLQINSAEGLLVGNPSYNFSNYSTDEAVFAGSIALQNMAAANWVGIEFKGGTQATSSSMFLGLNPTAAGNGELQFLNGSGQAVASIETNGSLHTSTALYLPDGTKQTTAWTGVLCGGDYAEAVNASGSKKAYEPGDVLVLASDKNGNVEKSSEAYSTMVAGIYATKPGVIGRRESLTKDSNDLPMAMVGIVPTKVSAENGPIHQGDLLVSSSRAGYAMKGTDRSRMLGAVIGKAMGSLDAGDGVIEVLVTLQ